MTRENAIFIVVEAQAHAQRAVKRFRTKDSSRYVIQWSPLGLWPCYAFLLCLLYAQKTRVSLLLTDNFQTNEIDKGLNTKHSA